MRMRSLLIELFRASSEKEEYRMINGEKITLASNCYEKNIDIVTDVAYAKKLFLYGLDCIDYRILLISNVRDKELAKEKCESLKKLNIIDDYIFSFDCGEAIQNIFRGCDRQSFLRKTTLREKMHALLSRKKIKSLYDGIYYSISQIAAIVTCPTKWLLFTTEDVQLHSETLENWGGQAINIINGKTEVLVANPIWNEKSDEAQKESLYEDEEFWYSECFSDQCFLINTDKLKSIKDILSEKNDECERVFPYYGGNCFERRICAYMKNHHLLRATYKNDFYIHSDIV